MPGAGIGGVVGYLFSRGQLLNEQQRIGVAFVHAAYREVAPSDVLQHPQQRQRGR